MLRTTIAFFLVATATTAQASLRPLRFALEQRATFDVTTAIRALTGRVGSVRFVLEGNPFQVGLYPDEGGDFGTPVEALEREADRVRTQEEEEGTQVA